MLRDQIKADITKAIDDLRLKIDDSEIEIARTNDAKFGDFSSNVALRLHRHSGDERSEDSRIDSGQARMTKENKQSAIDFAKFLTDSLKKQLYVEKLEVAGPGFINFWIKPEVWQKEVSDVLKNRGTMLNKDAEKRRIVVEFTDPNPFKEFHIGHLYSNIVGESICRLLEATGATVWRVNYQGDVGMHVAKTVWGIPKLLKQEGESFEDQEKKPLKARAFFLGQAYTLGSTEFEASEKVKKEVAEINQKIFDLLERHSEPYGSESSDSRLDSESKQIPKRVRDDNNGDYELLDLYQKGRKWSLEYFEQIYKRLGTKFDHYYFESEVGPIGADLVKKHLGKVFVESKGAIIFPGEKYGLHNRVFINSLGLPTYEAKELGLTPTKYKDFKYDESIIVTGNEINEYFKVLLKAMEFVALDLAVKTKHIGHGMVRMPGGKMSSRLGNVLLGEWLLDEAVSRVKKAFDKVSDKISEQVGVGAVKYALLKGNIGQDVNFSFEESISLNGNSGPYLQYTYARCRSVLAKAPNSTRHSRESGNLEHGSRIKYGMTGLEAEEEILLRALGHFSEVVFDAAASYSPNLLANFLYEVAQKYNTLYNNLPILKASETERSRRLFLTQATADILKKGLYLLGISAPEKM